MDVAARIRCADLHVGLAQVGRNLLQQCLQQFDLQIWGLSGHEASRGKESIDKMAAGRCLAHFCDSVEAILSESQLVRNFVE